MATVGTRTAAVGALVAALLALPAPTHAVKVNQTFSVPENGRFVVVGHGYGHGHGMSQYGALGAAKKGLSWKQILAFYYPGTSRATIGGRVKVKISADTTRDLQVSPRAGLKVADHGSKARYTLPTGKAKKWRLKLDSKGRTVVQWKASGPWKNWRTLKGQASFRAGGKPITLHTPGAKTSYRGQLHFIGPSGTRQRDTVNVVGLNNYVRGVIPREMPATWSANAVRAQAVAARTYASYELRHPKAGHYQLCDTTACQVYGGVSAEHPASNAAVDATRGVILTHRGAPAFTQFSSSSGGWTSANQFSYLPAQADPYDGHAGNPVHDWRAPVTSAKVQSTWPAVGKLREIQVTARDGNGEWKGRVQTLVLVGSKGKVSVRGDDFRYLLGLRSNWFAFAAK